jgi:hypothetical protein
LHGQLFDPGDQIIHAFQHRLLELQAGVGPVRIALILFGLGNGGAQIEGVGGSDRIILGAQNTFAAGDL